MALGISLPPIDADGVCGLVVADAVGDGWVGAKEDVAAWSLGLMGFAPRG